MHLVLEEMFIFATGATKMIFLQVDSCNKKQNNFEGSQFWGIPLVICFTWTVRTLLGVRLDSKGEHGFTLPRLLVGTLRVVGTRRWCHKPWQEILLKPSSQSFSEEFKLFCRSWIIQILFELLCSYVQARCGWLIFTLQALAVKHLISRSVKVEFFKSLILSKLA